MPVHIKNSNWGGEATELHLKRDGAWAEVDEAYTKVNGVWRMYHTAEVQVIAPLGGDARTAAEIINAAQPGLWAGPKRKRLIVQGGERGTLRIPTNFGGEFVLEIKPNGIISGSSVPEALAIDNTGSGKIVPVLNNGIIRGRGGNGGQGGTGGPGFYDYQTRDPADGSMLYSMVQPRYIWYRGGNNRDQTIGITWADQNILTLNTNIGNVTAYNGPDGWTYYMGPLRVSDRSYNAHSIYRQRTDRAYTGGGAGGAGGTGIGYGIARTNGVDGQFGGTNAGRGGRGGDGGNWGQNGGTGATGASGNNGVGTAGAAGTSAYAIWGNNRISYTGNGSVVGARVNN